MKTYNLGINSIPSNEDLKKLLGDNFYKSYRKMCSGIEIFLNPELEKWDNAGRRGKYYHGYVAKDILIDIYLIDSRLIKCEFNLPKRLFVKIQEKRDNIKAETREHTDTASDLNDHYKDSSLSFLLNNESDFAKIEQIIKIRSDARRKNNTLNRKLQL